jgi:hypothetical protein
MSGYKNREKRDEDFCKMALVEKYSGFFVIVKKSLFLRDAAC